MHECPWCYQQCDCDLDDLVLPALADHACINPACLPGLGDVQVDEAEDDGDTWSLDRAP